MSDQLLNVCLIAPLPPSKQSRDNHSCGGIATWTRRVCTYAKTRGDIKISLIDTLPRWRSLHSHPLWKRVIGGGYELLLSMTQLFRLLITQHIDVIHLTTSGQLGIVRDIGVMLIARLFKKSVIYHIRFGRIPNISENKTSEWKMISYAMLKADTVIVIDKATKNAVNKYLSEASVVLVPNCIDLSELPNSTILKPLKNIVLFVGWVVPSKGVAELLDAWSQIKMEGWQLKIAGPSDKAFQLELVEKYKTNNVEFLGEVPHEKVMELMATCGLFVLPSYTEGFPNVVLEAMALGKSILASDVGAIPEMLDGNCGKLVKPKDVESLKIGLESLLNNGQLRTEMGKLAKKKVLENYTIEVVFSNYMGIWRKALKKNI